MQIMKKGIQNFLIYDLQKIHGLMFLVATKEKNIDSMTQIDSGFFMEGNLGSTFLMKRIVQNREGKYFSSK